MMLYIHQHIPEVLVPNIQFRNKLKQWITIIMSIMQNKAAEIQTPNP